MEQFLDTINHWWAEYAVPLKILLILIFAFIVRFLLIVVLKRAVHQVVSGVKKSQDVTQTVELTQSPLLAARMIQRTRTLGTVGRNVITWFVVLTTFFIILDLLGVRVGTLIASAGFIAAGLAFGAQNLVKDLLNGLFIVFEDQLGVGDIITIGEVTGTVEGIGLRVTQVRAADGTLWFIRNGEILKIGNRSYGWSRVLINIDIDSAIAYQDVKNTIDEIVSDVIHTPELAKKTIEVPELLGVQSVQPDYKTYLLTVKTRPGSDEVIAREMRERLAVKFAARNIKIGLRIE